MKKSLCLPAVLLLISFLTGCTESSKKPWKDIKASELISQQQLPENKAMTVGLYIYLFHIRADKLPEIQEQISRTDTLSVKHNDPAAFLTNGLIGCAGDRISWQKIAQLLTQSQPEIKERINLLINENMPNDIVIAESPQPVSVIYHSGSATAGIGFDAGRTALRIKVEPLIGLRQFCRLDVTPLYRTSVRQRTKKLPVGQDNYEFAFESAAFSARLQPGQFVLLAPAQMRTDQTGTQTLADLMFYSQSPQNTANLCLIACGLINYPL